jgi:hypothetical protein
MIVGIYIYIFSFLFNIWVGNYLGYYFLGRNKNRREKTNEFHYEHRLHVNQNKHKIHHSYIFIYNISGYIDYMNPSMSKLSGISNFNKLLQ